MNPHSFCTCWPGATVWLTGPPGAGKTAIARVPAERLRERGRRVEALDRDGTRAILSPVSIREERDTGAQRVGLMAEILARNGIIALVPVTVPWANSREAVRRRHERSGTAHLEMQVVRDAMPPDGLPGVDGAYEAPAGADLRIAAHGQSVEESARALYRLPAEKELA
ncbi:adenylyl-sulfate kinase [Streptomyces olivoreticuli]